MKNKISYDELKNIIVSKSQNMMILGPAGSGKTAIIKHIQTILDNVLYVAPSGIASLNISGKTIQSAFCIKPNEYYFNGNLNIYNDEMINEIRNAKTLVIDEISMVRLEVLDIVDSKLRVIKEKDVPFGGLRLMFLGDTQQLGPVVKDEDAKCIRQYYNINNNDYSFYNADVIKNTNLLSTFIIYELKYDFRHQDDSIFCNILSELRIGNISDNTIKELNKQYSKNRIVNDSYQYLTVTNMTANNINNLFIDRLSSKKYYAHPKLQPLQMIYDKNINYQIKEGKKPLIIKKGMKIMFDINDHVNKRWVNGTIGVITDINATGDYVKSIKIKVYENTYEVFREKMPIYKPVFNTETGDYELTEVAKVLQFPFLPSWAITIDKSQGLTLDKIAIILENIKFRDNQLYVAISRTRRLENIYLSRQITKKDFNISSNMFNFYKSIFPDIIPVEK
jgi:ATP-dependent exoDNAse (exonuclease V) alpha subunit